MNLREFRVKDRDGRPFSVNLRESVSARSRQICLQHALPCPKGASVNLREFCVKDRDRKLFGVNLREPTWTGSVQCYHHIIL